MRSRLLAVVQLVWWWVRGLGARGQHYLGLCQRCGRRGVAHVAASSVLDCRRFAPVVLRQRSFRRAA